MLEFLPLYSMLYIAYVLYSQSNCLLLMLLTSFYTLHKTCQLSLVRKLICSITKSASFTGPNNFLCFLQKLTSLMDQLMFFVYDEILHLYRSK